MKLILQAIKALFRKIEASRTHWEEVEEVEILAETTVTISEDNSDAALPKTTQLTVGQTYFVILDGVSYECVAWQSDEDPDTVIIGNGAIYGGEGGNGEPFSCDSYSNGKIYLNTEKAGTYTISISTKENVVHKLDKKYLPDQTQPDWNQNDETAEDHIKNRTHYEEVLDEYVIFEGTLPANTSTTDLPLQYAIPSNTSVTAYYNGSIVATVVGSAMAGAANRVSHLFTPDLTLIVDNSAMTASVYNGFGDGVLKFVAENFTTVHTLDEKYLPNNVTGMINSKMDANNPVGTGSFSMGRKAGSIVGNNSHAEGYNTTASGDYSHAEGNSTTASGGYSHAEGNSTNVFSSVVTAVNPTDEDIKGAWYGKKFSVARAMGSHVEGGDSLALGLYSHAEGSNTTASGDSSHAEGSHTTASGSYSHAEGEYATASGSYSHAEGSFTTASSNYQHVQGRLNVVDSQNKYAHIVGNGKNSQVRSNAHTLDWKGVPWFKGRPQFGGTAQDQGSQTVMANGDKEIILKSSTANSTKKFKITVDDDYNVSATNTSNSVSKALATTEYVDNSVSNPLNITSAAVGQIVKITAVDDTGKPTAWEAADMPSGGSMRWQKIKELTLTEQTNSIVIGEDDNGVSVAEYNPIAMKVEFNVPADSTQTNNNGAPWLYPSATHMDNDIRAIGSIAAWKTTARRNIEFFIGDIDGIFAGGNINSQLVPDPSNKPNITVMNGVTLFINGTNDHWPVGTIVSLEVLSERA